MCKKYSISPIENQEKKTKFKNYSSNIANQLRTIDLEKTYGNDFISKNGLTINDYRELIERIDHCGSNQKYSVETKIDTDGLMHDTYQLVQNNACHCYSLCPACASAKRSEIINAIKPYVKTAEQIDNTFLYMVTITIRGSKSAESDYQKIRDSWTAFTKLGQRRHNGKRSMGEAAKFLGSVLSIEVIPENKDKDNFHVHGHALVLTDEKLQYTVYDQKKKSLLHKKYGDRIPKNELDKIALKTIDDIDKKTKMAVSKISEEWNDVSGSINIDVSPIKSRFIKGKKKSIENQLYEVIKYETKPWELEPLKMLETYTALKGKKRITKSGIFTQNKAAKSEWYELLEANDLTTYFNKLRFPDEHTETDDDIISVQRSSIEIDFNPENLKYQTTYSDKPFLHIETKEYKQYMSDKAKILSIYKNRISEHVKTLNDNSMFQDFNKIEWIAKKEAIKLIMKDSIKNITTNLKRFIRDYYQQLHLKPAA